MWFKRETRVEASGTGRLINLWLTFFGHNVTKPSRNNIYKTIPDLPC